MAKRKKHPGAKAGPRANRPRPQDGWGLRELYQHACGLAQRGEAVEAGRVYEKVRRAVTDPQLKALVCNDLAALAAQAGDTAAARAGLEEALALDPQCDGARLNLALLLADLPGPQPEEQVANPPGVDGRVNDCPTARATKVAILSFLFNWPSTGGGIVHTVELAHFLLRAGYDVRHFHARYAPWDIGRVGAALPFPSEALEFDEAGWNVPAIQERFRQAVARFAPDHALVTDSWNMKPLLAEAVRDYPYFLRLQAMECLCPLNNVRLLPEPGGAARQCPLHQLATPDACARCLQGRGHLSGSLHAAERALAGVGTPGYRDCLFRAFRDAEAVLVVNPLTEALVGPYARRVRIVTAGMDPARFPRPGAGGSEGERPDGRLRILFAGLVDEWMKGFHVLHEACARLWQRRQDFELLATADPAGPVDAFTRYVGWLSQEELPRRLRAADLLVMPTIAQEALGRTAVEAMAAGRPVVASRIGGLPATVADGATGLLCEPGDPDDLARKIEALLDDPDLRRRLGVAGRRRFEEHYAWDVIIERHYKPLLGPPRRGADGADGSQPAVASVRGGR